MKLIEKFAAHRGSSWWLHPSLLENDVIAVRAKLYGLGAITLFVLSVPVSIPYFLSGQIGLGLMTLSFGLLGACSLLSLRFFGSMSIASHLLCLALWGATTSGYMVLGGVNSYTNKWLIVMPMLGAFSNSRRTGWIWLGIAAATPVIFHILIEMGVLTPRLVFSQAQLRVMDLGNSLLFIVALSLVVFIIHAHHTWVISRLEKNERVLEASNVELTIARDDALRANHARDRFLANMSHELRTPLNGMLGYAEIIEEELHDEDITSHDADFAQIRTAGDNLLTMLHNILELTRFESTKVDLGREPLDPLLLIEQLVNRAPRYVHLDAHASWQGASLHTHRDTFSSLLEHVLDNACRFTEPDDQVGVIMHPRDEALDTYRIEIFDEGPGISPEEQQKIWEPFSQADSSVTREHDGAGLGLSLVRHFASCLDLRVSLQSSPGEGTHVFVSIPSAQMTHSAHS